MRRRRWGKTWPPQEELIRAANQEFAQIAMRLANPPVQP